jgi:hypothetical protein
MSKKTFLSVSENGIKIKFIWSDKGSIEVKKMEEVQSLDMHLTDAEQVQVLHNAQDVFGGFPSKFHNGIFLNVSSVDTIRELLPNILPE